MSVRNWESAVPFGELRREMERLFDQFAGGIGRGFPFRSAGYPVIDVWEDSDCFHIEAELAGLTMNDIDVEVSGRQVVLRGRCPESVGGDVTVHRQERHCGDFVRTVELPDEVQADDVEAVLSNGLLTVRLPKSMVARTHKVSVRVE